MPDEITYGVGGWMPDQPGGNIVARLVDHGDGTGTRTTYAADGNVTATEEVTGLPILSLPAVPVEDPAALLAAARDAVSKATSIAALRKATLELDELRARYPNA